MAEDIRSADPDPREMIERRRAEIQAEALRQMESCLYTSTMLYMWLRRVRIQHKVLVLLPILLTALAGFSYVKELIPAWGVALMAFLSTLIPSIAKALEIETHVADLKRSASEYKSLQDRFRILAKIGSAGDVVKAETSLTELMDRMDVARCNSLTPPERYFAAAQGKIKAGHYDFSTDIALRDAAARGLVIPLEKAV